MYQPGLEQLRLALYESDPLEIVNAFYCFDPAAIQEKGREYVIEHRLCCLAELIVSEMRNQFMCGRGSGLAEIAKQAAEIEQLRRERDEAREAARWWRRAARGHALPRGEQHPDSRWPWLEEE